MEGHPVWERWASLPFVKKYIEGPLAVFGRISTLLHPRSLSAFTKGVDINLLRPFLIYLLAIIWHLDVPFVIVPD